MSASADAAYPAIPLSISITNNMADTDSPISLVVARSLMLKKVIP